MARSLNLKVTAEGVETDEQLSIVRQEGCTEVQGYIFSTPKPAAALKRRYFADHAQQIADTDVPERTPGLAAFPAPESRPPETAPGAAPAPRTATAGS